MTDTYRPDEIEDKFGVIRRCGSMPSMPPEGHGLKAFASVFPTLTLDVARKQIAAKTWKAADVFPGEGEEDQHTTSACNGGALANGAWRAAYAGGNTKLAKRSQSYPYSLMNGGRDQGSHLYNAFKVGQQYGLPSLASCPWNLIYRNQTQQFDAEAALFKVDAPLLIHSWDELISAWAGPFFTIVAAHVGPNFERMNGDVIGLDNGSGNHAMAQTDSRVLDSGEIQGKVILNWGYQHGVRGCGWLGQRHLELPMRYHQLYAIPYGQHGAGSAK
jgi:hypothetical protein